MLDCSSRYLRSLWIRAPARLPVCSVPCFQDPAGGTRWSSRRRFALHQPQIKAPAAPRGSQMTPERKHAGHCIRTLPRSVQFLHLLPGPPNSKRPESLSHFEDSER